ncbi:MAG TPA: sulfatase-like hydrolase/transferase, partial [Pseudomonadales bacterium]|nr:sulfatase-like hydrolase/transferase [Pseudomonadales bacterium]
MRALLIIAVLLAALGAVGWMNRLDVLLWAAPKLIALRNPIEPNRVVDWSEGPAEAALPPNERPPNVILIVADDMGFNDVSFYNGGAADGSLQTPAIDAIAAQGVVFRNGYAANAVCAPSRASIMTGRYSTRFGFEFTPFWKIGATIFDMMSRLEPGPLPIDIDLDAADRLPAIEDQGMPASETTVAELLQDAGYYTAHIGKWHLGGAEGTLPEDQGFHDSLNMGSGTAYLPPDSPDVVNAVPGKDGIERMVWATMQYYVRFNGGDHFEPKGYLTDYYTDEALRVIEANRNRPFFLYLAHWGIHNPLQALKSDYEALAHIEDHSLRVYAAMIRALDRSVARVTAKLDELGLAENTLVIFTSDNGGAGYIGLPDINSPYRGWKLTH